MKSIYYKNYLNEWVRSSLVPSNKNLEWVRRNLAQNGVCEIFQK